MRRNRAETLKLLGNQFLHIIILWLFKDYRGRVQLATAQGWVIGLSLVSDRWIVWCGGSCWLIRAIVVRDSGISRLFLLDCVEHVGVSVAYCSFLSSTLDVGSRGSGYLSLFGWFFLDQWLFVAILRCQVWNILLLLLKGQKYYLLLYLYLRFYRLSNLANDGFRQLFLLWHEIWGLL